MDRHVPRLLGLFQKRIDGDDALLRLAQARFMEAELGAEYYAGSPEELQWLLGFRPSPALPVVVHLGRGINLFKYDSRALITEFVRHFGHDVYGFVIHDQAEIATDPDRYVSVLQGLERSLRSGPLLFIEYAVGLDPDVFLGLFRKIRDLEHISACVDTGHVGLRQVWRKYAQENNGEDAYSLSPSDPRLRERIEGLEEAVGSALPVLLDLIRGLAEIGKPLHFHLHDGHPLYKGPFGVSDHMSFFSEVPIPFEHRGKYSLPLMYGPLGLKEIVRTSMAVLDPALLSFSLEIHPPEGRSPLEGYEHLFQHWQDKTNAERMNHWISVLLANQSLLLGTKRE
ncbi:MAG: hypothetical protein HGA78_08110 [Nitrospirales bacterium]|nr:hypothetical protein [Nitrospirales bacterium]